MEALDDRALDHVADYFRALSEPLRLKLLNALRGGPLNVGELTSLLGCSQANVSKHLALLAKLGLVSRESRGTSVYYEIADPRTYQLCDLVCGQIAQRLIEQVQVMGGFGANLSTPQSNAQPAAKQKAKVKVNR
ncbi:MAG: metalloregulator ArsR/SmtB family transcription factor [Aquabacterium sp.]|nr:metalloregulator ArsR/SmtB family transcription factor [Aquabacterium sp.]